MAGGYRNGLVMDRLMSVLAILLVAGFVTILLRFALANHRSADRRAGRVWTQVSVLAAFVIVGSMILSVAMILGRPMALGR
jgi:hypothetical protein